MQTTEVQEQPNRIQVVLRVRPVLPHELADDVAVTCSPDARKLQVLLPDRLSGGANVLPGATRSGARSYEFDACLPGSTSQEELYETCGLQELVEAALDGYCVTVFAFGQTGSGKTHTIIGPRLSRGERGGGGGGGGTAAPSAATTGRLGPSLSGADRDRGAADDLIAVPGSAASARSAASAASAAGGGGGGGGGGAAVSGGITVDPEDGILTRCIAAAFRSIEARSATAEFAVTASVVELYNEAVTDLLALDKTKQLQVRKDSRDGFAVTGLTQVSCPNDVAAVRYMVRALQYRHTRGHKLNEYSSRSHCLMTFVFASKEAGPGGQMGAKGGIRRYGKLALVDLAGSERLKETGNTEKGAVRETGSINKSLFTLGQVLSALSARSSGAASTFVPFRDSKLTQLLWDGLRGSGRCLMLACLGPMRSAVEESLNTLHFATIATRIKAEPVVLLDPQDQLVLDLRKTITQLREENRQLAGALQQLSTGADPNAVLAALPETIRAHTGSLPYGSSGAASTGSGTASPTPPDEPGTPSTPLRQQQPHHLQPLQPWQQQVLDRTPRQPFESAVLEASAAVGNGVGGAAGAGAGGTGFASGIPPPPHRQQQSAPAALVQGSASSAPLRASYGSSVGGGGGAAAAASMPQLYPQQAAPPQLYQQQSPQPPSYQQHPPQPLPPPPPYQQQPPSNGQPQQYQQYQPYQPYAQQQRGPPPLLDVPNQASPVSSRSRGGKPAVGSGGNGRRQSPVHAAYGVSDGRNGGRKTVGGGKGASPRDGGRSKSVGRGRPTYLTEDPGALLFGFSNALQPPPGSGNSSSMSLPALVPPAARGSGGVAPPPPMLTDFPELAAMEAEFQSMLANGGPPKRVPATSGSGAYGSNAASASGGSVTAPGGGAGAGAAAAVTTASGEAEDDGPRPDVRALKWAERNNWFGTDFDMTAFAYQVHDRLVDVEHVDPSSDLYYMEIERRVAEKFPERWARAMKGQLPGGSGAAAAAAVRRAAPSPNRIRAPGEPPGSSPQPASPSYSAALRVHVKEPLHRSGSGGASAATNREIAASLAAQAAVARAKQQRQQQVYQHQPQVTTSYDSGPYEPSYGEQSSSGGVSGPATPLYGAAAAAPPPPSGSAPDTPPLNGVNPFNIGALHSMAPPKAAPRATQGQGLVLMPAGAEPLGRGGSTAIDALSADPNAAERIQREYARQRAMVVEELRKAKEDAEAERQRILARIQRAAGGNKWR